MTPYPPNLDAMTEQDALDAAQVFSWLCRYAGLKARALPARAKGDIVLARALEDECDTIYNKLPEWARW